MMTRQAAVDPDFRDGGDGGGVLRCQSQRGVRGPPTYYLANLAENYMKMKKLDRGGGERVQNFIIHQPLCWYYRPGTVNSNTVN